jgi:hypothetical protein
MTSNATFLALLLGGIPLVTLLLWGVISLFRFFAGEWLDGKESKEDA